MPLKTILIIWLLTGLYILVPEPLFAQHSSRQVRQAERKKERQERVDRRNYEKEREKLRKEHINRQTPEVQERIKRNERESRRMKRPTRPPFYKRWFRKKPN